MKKIVFGLFFTIFLLSALFGKNAPRGSYFYLINGLASEDLTTAQNGDQIHLYLRPNAQCYLKSVLKTSPSGNMEMKEQVFLDASIKNLILEYVYHSEEIIVPFFDTVLAWHGANTMPYHSKDSSVFFIYTPEDLAYFSQNCHSKWMTVFTDSSKAKSNILILNDLDLGGVNNIEWMPIGVCDTVLYFHANIDGNNKKIKNLYLNCENLPSKTGSFIYQAAGVRIEKLHFVEGEVVNITDNGASGLCLNLLNSEILSCSNGMLFYSDMKGISNFDYRRAICGFVQRFYCCVLKDNLFFGDIISMKSAQVGFFSGAFEPVPYSATNREGIVQNCINYGHLIHADSINPKTYYNSGIISIFEENLSLKGCINLGLIYPKGTGFLVGSNSSRDKKDSCFLDNQMCPNIMIFSVPKGIFPCRKCLIDSDTLSTRRLLGFGLRSRIGNSDAFIFENGFYPRLKNIDERVGRLSSSPLILAEGENVLGVSSDFYVDTNYGVRWESSAPDIVSIQGNKCIIRMHNKDTLVKIYARLEGFSKHIYLIIKPRSFYEKITDSSLCMGDSCFFAGMYRKESGEYRDTLYRSGLNDMDSIFVLNLNFYPASDTSIDVFIFSKDLPYVFNGKSYTDFGKDTLYYTNVNGCDSILYFRLEEIVEKYRIGITTNAGGQVNPVRDVLVDRGDSLRVWWQADTCFILDSLFVDNRLYPFAGHNSYLFTDITTDHSIRFVFKSDRIYLDSISRPDIHCGQEFLDFRFMVKAGHPSYYDLDFDNTAIQKGFVQERKDIEHNPQEVSFRVPLKPYVNTYFAYLYAGNAQGCKSKIDTIPVEIHYPAQDVVRQKWKDVLAVRNDEYNGGYFFTAFQWIQDEKILKKDTLFRLFQPKGLRKKSVYRVLLTREDGTTISSCPIIPTFEEASSFNVYPNPIKENGSISIHIDDCQEDDCGQFTLVDVQGKMISVHLLKGGLNTYATTLKQGMYMVEIKRETGEKRVLKLIVVK